MEYNRYPTMKRPRIPSQSLFPPLSAATLIGIALFITYVGSAILSTLPISSRNYLESVSSGVAALYTRKEELEYCKKHPPIADENNTSCLYSSEHQKTSNRTIFMQPYGGLGNRLRAMASAFTIAREVGANVVIVWVEKEHGFRGAFSDLFESPKVPVGCFPGQALREDHALCKVRRINHFDEWNALKNSKTAWEKIGGQEVMCLQSMMFLTGKQREISWFFSLLKPVVHIYDAITHFQEQVQWNSWGQWIGMHIRRTDLRLRCNTEFCQEGLKASEVLPLSAYINVTSQIVDFTKQTGQKPRFFLATDDPLTEIAVRRELLAAGLNEENAVVSYKKSIRDTSSSSLQMRNTAAGIEEAVVDLWLLSSSKVVIGTVGSSYSQTAKLMGSSPFFVSVGAEYENRL